MSAAETKPPRILIREAAPVICAAFGASWADVRKSRRYGPKSPAHYVVYWAWTAGGFGAYQIASAIGRDVSTLHNSFKLIELRLAASCRERVAYDRLMASITPLVIERRAQAAAAAEAEWRNIFLETRTSSHA